jgi:carbamate kinase
MADGVHRYRDATDIPAGRTARRLTMLVVTALGPNALVPRGESVAAEKLRAKVTIAAEAFAAIAAEHQLVIALGNGPQVGLLALQASAYAGVESYPVDVLGVQTEEAIGYMIEQELGNLLPVHRPVATILTMVEVDRCDPAFRNPTTFVGPVYLRYEAESLTRTKGWVFRPEGDKWRRVVASPEPKRVLELRPITWLLERDTVVIAAGGGGIPTMRLKEPHRRHTGAECVIDRDLAAELLAREVGADVFVMLTDVDAAYADWGTPSRRAIRRASPAALATVRFAARSMGAKVEAACRFATATGKRAAIGAVSDLTRIVQGTAGTTISTDGPPLVWAAEDSVAANSAKDALEVT